MKITDMSFKEGLELKIRVKPKDGCGSFSINIGQDSKNIALHFNPRFNSGGDTNTIVCNSLSGGCWGKEERDGNFPFSRGEENKFYINYNNKQFYIKLPDGSMMNFPNRPGDVKYNFLDVSGDAEIIGIKMK
ncbi:beta-galactoside-binding lectin-like [Scomber japonicus]|uniref:beta-galactoside-binding lectin-like n=1 Tax=Scomber japonicus TaxID=13676 RepID=UPI00230656CA|nr:beta-galactoside-binding lectin-like [Scomber japonicus]